MKLNKEFKIGLTAISAFAILIWGLNFLKGNDIFFSGNKYYGIYKRVDGLTDASPVYYKGFKIGAVRNIEIHDINKVNFIVTFEINDDVTFPSNTIAQIYSLDLMGSKGVQFIEGDSKTFLNPGDTLKSSVIGDFVDQMSMQVLPLKEKTEKLIVKLDSTLTQLSDYFSPENKKRFDRIMQSLDNTMVNIDHISAEADRKLKTGGVIDNSLNNIDSLVASVAAKRQEIISTIDNLSEFSKNLAKADLNESLGSLKNTLGEVDSLLMTVNSGEGSLGMMLHDKELYYRLTDASADLDRLLLDVKHNPKRYLSFSAINFGKKVYIQDNGLGKNGIAFMVLLKKSEKPIDHLAGKEIESGLRIYEDYDGDNYLYTTGQSNSYEEAENILSRVKPQYPDANIIAYEYGQSIRVNKAIKKTK